MKNTSGYFLNPESVSRHLYCSVCQDVFNEPQRAPCGHSFCKTCITSWLQQSKTCPEDRKPVTMKQLHYDFILANIINDQMVACPYRLRGCDFVNKLEMLGSHKKTCSYNPVNLPAFMRDDETENVRPIVTTLGEDGNEKLPTPAKPSLKMRLFQDSNKRSLLCSVFDSKENEASSSSSSSNNTKHKHKDSERTKRKKRKVVHDDSF